MRKKSIAGFFALVMGVFGLHHFYLNNRKRGILYFAATVLLFIISINKDAPIVLIMGLVATIDAMVLFSMPTEEFDQKYNSVARQAQRAEQFQRNLPQRPLEKALPTPVTNPFKASGVQKFKEYDYEGAIGDFKKALEAKYDDPAVHFNLACSYSLVERTDPAFFHLTKAVHFGFVDFDKIENHQALAYLRTQPEFLEFVKNGYQRFGTPPTAVQEEKLVMEDKPQREETLLEQIKRLGELRNKGILTEEEYVVQTKKVLGN
ncbi:MAG: TM2 domain-containing protein [Lewinellaceae bacterium]|nr:TM2 domain-containing protein [Saprospiraceae bacterium]MCB9341411.1 TM2 domain-containing protein [Lewinellaceae bacterium]